MFLVFRHFAFRLVLILSWSWKKLLLRPSFPKTRFLKIDNFLREINDFPKQFLKRRFRFYRVDRLFVRPTGKAYQHDRYNVLFYQPARWPRQDEWVAAEDKKKNKKAYIILIIKPSSWSAVLLWKLLSHVGFWENNWSASPHGAYMIISWKEKNATATVTPLP